MLEFLKSTYIYICGKLRTIYPHITLTQGILKNTIYLNTCTDSSQRMRHLIKHFNGAEPLLFCLISTQQLTKANTSSDLCMSKSSMNQRGHINVIDCKAMVLMLGRKLIINRNQSRFTLLVRWSKIEKITF